MSLHKMSKYLSYVLRHNPAELGLSLQEGGWVDVETLLEAASSSDIRWDRQTLDKIVATDKKSRYAFSEDGSQIRANQGHSVDVDLGLEPVDPPEFLFHGTARRFEDAIASEGLRSMSRHHVHLSTNLKTAYNVGSRHGVPVIFQIDTAAALEAGLIFFVSANGVWLIEEVPPHCLSVVTLPE